MRILFVSHTDPFGPFRIGSHHLAAALARDGHDVVHLSTPISRAHLITRRVSRAKALITPRESVSGDGVTYLVPRTLLPAGAGPFRAVRELRRRGSPRFDLALLDQPLLWSPSLREVARRLVYRPTDEYPSGLKARRQRDILEYADGVIATSGEVLRRMGHIDVPAIVLENGVDIDRFRLTGGASRSSTCIYVGAFDARFDWDQTVRWAEEYPGWTFRLIGPISRAPTVPPNIELVGAVPYEHVPGILADAQVGMLPLSADTLNRGRSPMKLYEYLASGLAVVSRATPVIDADPDAGVHTYADAREASRAMRDAMMQATPNVRGAELAQTRSWTAKREELLEFVASLPSV